MINDNLPAGYIEQDPCYFCSDCSDEISEADAEMWGKCRYCRNGDIVIVKEPDTGPFEKKITMASHPLFNTFDQKRNQ
jgi:DNA-directed RNA polymerase subunit RPC12/RpoP